MNAYVYEGLTLKNYFKLFFKLIKFANLKLLIEPRLYLLFVILINKRFYRFIRRKLKKGEYEVNNKSVNLKWDY